MNSFQKRWCGCNGKTHLYARQSISCQNKMEILLLGKLAAMIKMTCIV